MKKIFQNSKAMLNYSKDFWSVSEMFIDAYWCAEHGLSYTVYEMNGMQFEVTNEGHGYGKWVVKGLTHSCFGTAPTKALALDIIEKVSQNNLVKYN